MILEVQKLRELAKQAGFDLAGFARPDPIPPEALSHWLESGLNADMDWMSARAAERLDPKKILPTAQTVIALACNYYRWEPQAEESPISRYARGRDYHQTLRDRIRTFRRLVREYAPGTDDYASVDTGAMMERVWAVRAGLGYVGRNGCLITPQFGSWVFLAAFVIDREVDQYSAPATVDHCGSCTLCIQACPTEAILPDRFVDAGRCLSYQTIENAGEVPAPLRHAFANIAFGCDICQQVCPLNAAPVPADDRFAPRAVAQLGARELAALTKEQYQQYIPGTPLGRAQYDGLRRNAAYALGAMKDEGARDILQQLATDPSERVANAARWALEELARSR